MVPVPPRVRALVLPSEVEQRRLRARATDQSELRLVALVEHYVALLGVALQATPPFIPEAEDHSLSLVGPMTLENARHLVTVVHLGGRQRLGEACPRPPRPQC